VRICILYKERETNAAKKLGVSTVTLRNWVGLNNNSTNIDSSTMEQDTPSNEIELPGSPAGRSFNNDIPSYYSNLNEPSGFIENAKDLNYSSAHCLHQNIETLTCSLIDKIDTLQKTQLDIHHIEIITDRVFHNIEKLKNEIRVNNSYVQLIEQKNKCLEAKIDVLLMQNEAITQKCTEFELLGERFFSKNIELENKLLALEHRFHFPDIYESVSEPVPKTRVTTNLEEDAVFNDEETKQQSGIKPSITPEDDNRAFHELYNTGDSEYSYSSNEAEKENNQTIDDLRQTKKNVEAFIKQKYPEDYSKLRQHDKKSFFKWFNRFWG
jgi:hypothetical protein